MLRSLGIVPWDEIQWWWLRGGQSSKWRRKKKIHENHIFAIAQISSGCTKFIRHAISLILSIICDTIMVFSSSHLFTIKQSYNLFIYFLFSLLQLFFFHFFRAIESRLYVVYVMVKKCGWYCNYILHFFFSAMCFLGKFYLQSCIVDEMALSPTNLYIFLFHYCITVFKPLICGTAVC